MSPITVGLIGFVALFALLAVGLPVGVGMALVGFAGFWYMVSQGAAIVKMATVPFDTVCNWDLATLPLFMLMAQVLFVSGIGKDLYDVAAKWVGHLPGGLAIATVVASGVFGACSASSLAGSATMGLVAVPEMRRHKYDPALATGSVAAGGPMGSLIPPSGPLIIYGILTETSIGKLFIAGAVPALILAVFYIITIYILCRWKPNLGPRGPSFSWRERVVALGSCAEVVGLILLILGGLMAGWFTPTEAGAVGAFGAIVFSLFRKRLDWEKFKEALVDSLKTTGMIYVILIGAKVFNYFATVTTIPTWLASFVGGLPLSPLGIMGIIMIIYLILGCFIDASAMQVLTVPIFFPVALSLGFDLIWFGIFVDFAMEIAMITPPVGMSVYVVAGVVPDVPMQTIFKGIFPFLIADFCGVAVLMLAPATALFLPSFMRY